MTRDRTTPDPATSDPAASGPTTPEVLDAATGLTGDDVYLFNEGSHVRLYERLGAHLTTVDDVAGVSFGVWAPNAESVQVIGSFNGWNAGAHPLRAVGSSGIWAAFVPGVTVGDRYKFQVRSRHGITDKADPFAFATEIPPATSSVVSDLAYDWGDGAWMSQRAERDARAAPMSTYELHAGSWRRVPDGNGGQRSLSYRELGEHLAEYLPDLGFTHVELVPVMEHPFYGSWGYQTTAYFAPTARFGTPHDLMYMIDCLHQAGIAVILDWVPSHFPNDEHGLARFDGTHLYEHEDPRLGFHPDWKSCVFNYGRHEVRSFLLSSALMWLDRYHADGLRVDAVASMLYLDYSRGPGEWIPNRYGGRENLDAIGFLRRLNEEVYHHHPGTETIAEESTAWPMVSRPTYVGGLGFGFKWDMGWMHDTLEYMQRDPIHRAHHHHELTFRMVYGYDESFVLPLSHDEVVHGKGSLIGKMPGDEWQKFANLRLLYGYQWAVPGKKLLFMGGEIGQGTEWSHEGSVEWTLLEHDLHAGVQRWVGHLNRTYVALDALHQGDCDPDGFQWVDADNAAESVVAFLRRVPRQATPGRNVVLVVANFTPTVRHSYRVGVPQAGHWREIANSDAVEYGGSGQGNLGEVEATPFPSHDQPASLVLTLPPLAVLYLEPAPRTAD